MPSMEGSDRHRQIQPPAQEQTQVHPSHGPGPVPGIAPLMQAHAHATQMTTVGQPPPQTYYPPPLPQMDPAHLYYPQPPPGAAQPHTSSVAAQGNLQSRAFCPYVNRTTYPQYPSARSQSHYGYMPQPYYSSFGNPPANLPYTQQALNPQGHFLPMPPYSQALASASDQQARGSAPLAPTMGHQLSAAERAPLTPHPLPMGRATAPAPNPPELTNRHAQTAPLEGPWDGRIPVASRLQTRASTSTDDCNGPAAWRSEQDGHLRSHVGFGYTLALSANDTPTLDLRLPPRHNTLSNRRNFDSFQGDGPEAASVGNPAQPPPRQERRRRVERRPPPSVHPHQAASHQMAAQQMQTHRLQASRNPSSRRFAHPNTPTDKQIVELFACMKENLLLAPHIPADDNTCGICTKEYATEKCDPTEEEENALRVPCPAKHTFGEWCIRTWIRTCITQRNVIACPKCRTALIEPREKPPHSAHRQLTRDMVASLYAEHRAQFEEEEEALILAEQELEAAHRRIDRRIAGLAAAQQTHAYYTPSVYPTLTGQEEGSRFFPRPHGNLASNQRPPSGPSMGTFPVSRNDPTTLPLAARAAERPVRLQQEIRPDQAFPGQQGRTAAEQGGRAADDDTEEDTGEDTEEEMEEDTEEEDEEERTHQGREYDDYDEEIMGEEDESGDDETEIQV